MASSARSGPAAAAGSTGSRTPHGSRHGRTRRSAPKVFKEPPPSFDHNWSRVVAETEALTAEVLKAVKSGQPVSRLTWKKFDNLEVRARVPPKGVPGPGAYHAATDSAFGKQVANRSTAPSVALGPAVPVKHKFVLPLSSPDARRVKCLPADVSIPKESVALRSTEPCLRSSIIFSRAHATEIVAKAKHRRSTGEIATTDNAPVPSSIGPQIMSQYQSQHGPTLKSRLVDLDLLRAAETPSGEVLSSAVGRQVLSTRPSAGAFSFGASKRVPPRTVEEELKNLPGPGSYEVKFHATYPAAPAYSVSGNTLPEYNPFLDVRAAPGLYDIPDSLGKQVLSGYRSSSAIPIGPGIGATLNRDMRTAIFLQAHERLQPLGVRDVPTRGSTMRLSSSQSTPALSATNH